MNSSHGNFLGWPGWRHLTLALRLACGVGVVFLIVYGGANCLTSKHSFRVSWNFEFEKNTPFYAPAVLVYLSLNVILWLSPFVLRTRREIIALAATLVSLTLVAAPFFVFLPADAVHDPPSDLGLWAAPVGFAKGLALPNNFMPSLHVAFATICTAAFTKHAAVWAKIAMAVWLGSLATSTLLLHEHYLIDVLSGFALAFLGLHFVYDRWTITEDQTSQ